MTVMPASAAVAATAEMLVGNGGSGLGLLITIIVVFVVRQWLRKDD
jgi:hypothetical protein